MSKTNSSETLLKVENLVTYFYTSLGVVKAVDGITFDVKKGEVVGLVGESGSGKSVTCLSILRTVPRPGKIVDGKIIFKGSNILEKSEAEMQKIRGKEISMIFQNPAFSLNPIYTIGEQLVEILRWHMGLNKEEAVEKVLKLLKDVKLSDPQKRFNQYPHELSGGMKQRVVIARALLCSPSLLLADEPTTNVDVTVQAQLLNLLNELKKDFNMTILFVTHDMGIVAQLTNKVVVLYSGKVCEIADTETIFSQARHPYTEALISSVPRFDYRTVQRQKLKVIEGSIPDSISPPPGCRFHPRCAYAGTFCKSMIPELLEVEPGHMVACFRVKK